MYDANMILQAAVTKVTDFASTGFDLKTGTPRRGMDARFLITSHKSVGTAGAVWQCSIEESDDNTTFNTVGSSPLFTSATAAAAREVFVQFMTRKRYIRPKVTLTTAAGTPEIVYSVECGEAQP